MGGNKKSASKAELKSSNKKSSSNEERSKKNMYESANVEYSTSPTHEIGSVDDFVNALQSKNVVAYLDMEVATEIAGLSEESFADDAYSVVSLVLLGKKNCKIAEDKGDLFSQLVTVLGQLPNLRLLVFSGHEFHSISLDAEFSENLSALVLDNCSATNVSVEEECCENLKALAFHNVAFGDIVFHHSSLSSLNEFLMDKSGCATFTIEDSCMINCTSFRMEKIEELRDFSIGENALQTCVELSLKMKELEHLTFHGNNCVDLQVLDLSYLKHLIEFECGDDAFMNSTQIIVEDVSTLRSIIFGNGSFTNGDFIQFINLMNLRLLEFGAKTFRKLSSYESLKLGDLLKLETLQFGSDCLSKLDRFVLLKNKNLRNVTLGKNALKRCEYFILMNYQNRIHLEEENGILNFIPEEYPGLPLEAEITCLPGSLRIEACAKLATFIVGKGALPEMKHIEFSFLHRLKELSFPENAFEECIDFSMSDNAKLSSLLLPQGSFTNCNYISIQNLPELKEMEVQDDVMSNGGFCIMRNLYPTTIDISKQSFTCTSASYKSIPKKLQRVITKNCTPFQKKIASDAFLGQTLVYSIGIIGLVAITVIGLL